jgi:vesicular inhibitory amino acid transporter
MAAVITASTTRLQHHPRHEFEAPRLQELPQTFGMLLFSFSAHGTFPDHEFAMREPKKFPRILGCTFFMLAIAKLGFGVAAYMAYGDGTEEIATSNLERIPKTIANVAITMNTFLSIPLPLHVVFRLLAILRQEAQTATSSRQLKTTSTKEADVSINSGNAVCAGESEVCSLLERAAVVLCCGGLAAAIPHFALVMGVIGSIAGTFLTFIGPVVFFLRLHGDTTPPFIRAILYAHLPVALAAGAWSFFSAVEHIRRNTT